MTVTPDDFRTSAEKLLSGEHEIDYRNSASRAYYALYYYCNIFAIRQKLPQEDQGNVGSHVKLILRYSRYSGDKLDRLEVRKIGKALTHCKKIRIKADYKIGQNFLDDDAKMALEYAKKVKNKLVAMNK